MYDDTYEVSNTKTATVTNTMRYAGLKREDLGAKFTCQASNTNRTPPVSREIHISLNSKSVAGRMEENVTFACPVPPTGLSILEKPTYVSEGKSRLVTCQAVGGFPPPQISWWIGTRQLQPQQTVRTACQQMVVYHG